MPHRRYSLLLACLIFALPRDSIRAADVVWLTGAKLQQQLTLPSSVSWTGAPLRKSLYALGEAQKVAVLLDRRIDPDQKLDLSIENDSLEIAFKKIAARGKLGYSQLGPVAYFGPPATAAKLRTLSALRKEEINKLPAAAHGPLARQAAFRWDDLATPRDLLAQLTTESGIEVKNLDLLPHDLWAGARLPALGWTDRATLVAVQFDLTFSFDSSGKTLTLAAIPENVTLERSYTLGGNAENVKKFSAAFPNSQLRVAGGKLHIRGPAEDHDLIEQALAGKTARKTSVTPGKQVYTLQVNQAPVGKLLQQLGKQLEFDVQLDEAAIRAAGHTLETPVSLDVKNVSADELLKAACEPASLAFTLDGKTLKVGPKK